jgi:hypothetical protein
MATTITAGNATNGAAISSDGTGTLDIKTGTGAGTTAISVNASQVVTMPGPVAIPGNLVVTGSITAGSGTGDYAMNAYVAPTTWTKPAGLKAVKVTVVGAGGAGGSAPTPTNGSASGGGSGGAAIEYIDAPAIPGPVGITAGPGTNSFGAFCSATAGAAGSGASGNIATGGAGGSGTGGTVNINGNSGGGSFSVPGQAYSISGAGAPSILGIGGNTVVAGGVVNGTPGTGYGGGGSGSVKQGPGTSAGGTGAPGIVIVEEFY